MIEVNLRPGLQPQRNLVLILPTIENPNQACLPRDLNPGRPANQEAVVFIPRGFQRTSRTFNDSTKYDMTSCKVDFLYAIADVTSTYCFTVHSAVCLEM
jgi:hypothetical protein